MLCGVSQSEPGGEETTRRVREVGDHPALTALARGGFVASGLLHVVMGWIAVQVVLETDERPVDPGGALDQLSDAPLGAVLLWACALGFWALALVEAITAGVGICRPVDRFRSAAKAAVYAVLGVWAATHARGEGQDGGETSAGVTGVVMAQPGGRTLVALIGLVIAGVGVYHVVKGVRRRFLRDLESTGGPGIGHGIIVTGVLGYALKGVALLVVGGFFGVVAWTVDPDGATGMDGALRALADQPFGVAALLVVGAGFVLYGGYSMARARYARM
jgi:hypothetical protein